MKIRRQHVSFAMKAVRVTLRILLGTSLALFISGGPGYRQAMDAHSQWVPRWQMFSGMALGIVRVHIEVRDGASSSPRTCTGKTTFKSRILEWGPDESLLDAILHRADSFE